MDGTLLDLRFDNTFWQHTIPIHYARLHAITPDEAVEILAPIFHREAGNLNWYCLDFWSEQLGFDVAQLKRTESHGIAWRPEAEQFLKQLSASHCEVILVTNAHPDTLAIKMDVVNLDPWFDHVVSSHYFRAPKESLVFWDTLRGKHGFNPDTTLFIDDSEPILASAGEYGIRHLITLLQPDSTLPPREATDYPAIRHFSDITEGLPHAR
jgi:putative hydrolase of the HAD superfamily